MATKTIGQLTQATTINNADEFAIEQSGVTKRVAASVVRGDIVNANIKSDAAIAYSKLAPLNSAQILVGNGSNVPTAVSVTGDVTISNAGVTAIASGAVVTADVADAAITPAKLSQPYTLATAQASTSGTSIDFTGIPSWAKRITVMFDGVSTSGSASVIIRLGTSSGFVASGYLGSNGIANYTTGLPVDDITNSAGVRHGCVQIINVSSNSWVSAGSMGRSDAAGSYSSGGSISLASALTQIRITTGNGTDTFDAGTINIAYEG